MRFVCLAAAALLGVVACGEIYELDPGPTNDGGADAGRDGARDTGSIDSGNDRNVQERECGSLNFRLSPSLVDLPTGLNVARGATSPTWYFAQPTTGSDLDLVMKGQASDPPDLLAKLNSTRDEDFATVSPDETIITFDTNAGGTHLLQYARRADRASPFPEAATVNISRSYAEPYMVVSADGVFVYFVSTVMGTEHHLFEGRLDVTKAQPELVDIKEPIPSTAGVSYPVVSADRKEIFFAVKDTMGLRLQYHAAWNEGAAAFDEPVVLVFPAEVPANEMHPSWISPDGCDLYYGQRPSSGGPAPLVHLTRK